MLPGYQYPTGFLLDFVTKLEISIIPANLSLQRRNNLRVHNDMIGISQHFHHFGNVLDGYFRHLVIVIIPLIVKTTTKGKNKQKQYNRIYFHNLMFLILFIPGVINRIRRSKLHITPIRLQFRSSGICLFLQILLYRGSKKIEPPILNLRPS